MCNHSLDKVLHNARLTDILYGSLRSMPQSTIITVRIYPFELNNSGLY